jgi:hypothetical protein
VSSLLSRPIISRDVTRGFFSKYMKEDAPQTTISYTSQVGFRTFKSQSSRARCVRSWRDAIDSDRIQKPPEYHARFSTEIHA